MFVKQQQFKNLKIRKVTMVYLLLFPSLYMKSGHIVLFPDFLDFSRLFVFIKKVTQIFPVFFKLFRNNFVYFFIFLFSC